MFLLNISNCCSDKDEIFAIPINLLLFLLNKKKTNWQLSRKFRLFRNNDLKCLKETYVLQWKFKTCILFTTNSSSSEGLFFAKSHSSCRQKLLSTSYSQHTSFFHVKSVNKSRSTRLFAAALVFGCAKVHVYRFARTIEEQQCF